MEAIKQVARRLLGRPTPSPERRMLAALRAAGRRIPPKREGGIAVGGYHLRFADVRTVTAQWTELFLQSRLRFTAASRSPRILDCGGNHGLATLYFKHLYPAARVTVFEPDPRLHGLCRANLTANGWADVEVVRAAVWTAAGTADFCCEGADSGTLCELAYDGLAGERRAVPTVRLRDYLEGEPVDLLKLDVEGAEFAVLHDCAPALGNVARLVIELHETDPAVRGTADVLDLLTAAGFRFTLDSLSPMSWRNDPQPADGPFPGKFGSWVVMVYAWRPGARPHRADAATEPGLASLARGGA